ncbi:retinitis pigmentosa 1-like 1 protein [Rhodamnia argentea]|uniref:Retinitis pigmentosa 1-like 1 protein n=1 Tax=Rhodamnia argentea TaxID=178133 RepID=A0A8B8NYU9_9MYRT|nr:retinitis pigmentosa 1-like 1 protein [Rhodamnia argentea]
MMDSPFFRSHWSAPSQPRPRYYSPPVRAVPIHRPAAPSPSPKVVSIPVHFVGSERSRSASALKIQSVFRGFLVRRSVRRIAAVRREVDEVERRISTAEAVELLRRDERERLKVNETLMSLLFRLDSVRGVDGGVRECRKAVTRRAIALQERVDAIVAGQSMDDSAKEADVEGGDVAERESAEADNRGSGVAPLSSTTEAVTARLGEGSGPEMADAEHSVDAGSESYQTEETPAAREVHAAPEADVAAKPEGEHSVEADAGRDREMEQPAAAEVDTEAREPETEMHANGDEITADNYTVQSPCEPVGDAMATGAESSADSSTNPQSLVEGIDENAPPKEDAGTEAPKPDEDEESGGWESAEKDSRRSKELLERMVEDNEKIMGLMAEIFERNERQTRLLSSLSQRVEQLERAFLCEKLRRKKRRQAAGRCDGIDCSATSPDPKKWEKR